LQLFAQFPNQLLLKNNYEVIITVMNFLTYFLSMSVPERYKLAIRCGTSFQHLKNIAYDTKGIKVANEKLCINIERESGGLVRCESLRPDVDWAFLRNSKLAA